MSNQFKKTWRIPLILASLTAFGLMASLLGSGFWWALSWISMITPLAIILRKVLDTREG